MIRLQQLTKVYRHSGADLTVLDGLDLSVDAGEIFAVVGPSGAGKSTLAQCVTLLERPTSGSVVVNGDDLTRLGERDLRAARRRIGTIFQQDGLFARRTAAQNVALPLEYLGATAAATRSRVGELLDRVGLADRADHYPHQLSGGQRQRVGIARALALRPSVLLSDEATSGLDPDATASIVGLLRELRDDLGLSILFITHEMDTVLQVADAAARLDRGHLVEQGPLVDLLRDPGSELGRALRPVHRATGAPDGAATWFVQFVDPAVPSDWITRLADAVGAPISLLGASIEVVGGATVGHATIAVTDAAGRRLPNELARLGLVGRPVTGGAEARAEAGTADAVSRDGAEARAEARAEGRPVAGLERVA